MLDFSVITLRWLLLGFVFASALVQYTLNNKFAHSKRKKLSFTYIIVLLLLEIWGSFAVFNPMIPFPTVFKQRGFLVIRAVVELLFISGGLVGCAIGILTYKLRTKYHKKY